MSLRKKMAMVNKRLLPKLMATQQANSHANARLIAAAPKRHSDFLRMMEALKNIQADAIACQFGIKEGLITDIYRASEYFESIERLAETAIVKGRGLLNQ